MRWTGNPELSAKYIKTAILPSIEESTHKEVWELIDDDCFIDYDDYFAARINNEKFLQRNQLIPADVVSPWNLIDIPLGAYRWRSHGGSDISVSKLVEIDVNSDSVRTLKFSTDDNKIGRQKKFQYYADILGNDIVVPYLEAYKHGSDIYVTDNYHWLMAAKIAGLSTMVTWVEELNVHGLTKTRTEYIRDAISEGKPVSQALVERIERGELGPEAPEEYLLWSYKEKRRYAYPSIGDQLGALYKSRHGDNSELEQLDLHINQIKSKYPKNQ